MSRTQMTAAKAVAVLAPSMLMIGQAGAGTLERALACQLTPEELPSLMTNLRARDSGFKKPVTQLGMPMMDVFKLEAPVTAHARPADEVMVAPARIALVLCGTTCAQLVGELQLRRDVSDEEALKYFQGIDNLPRPNK